MAEQIGHNVVNNEQSTSGQPLVDAAVNPTTTESAADGNQATQLPSTTESTTDKQQPFETAIKSTTGTHDSISREATEYHKADGQAEPSAGDAAATAVQDSAHTHAAQTADKNRIGAEEHVNGMREDADGPADEVRSNADVSVDISVNSDTDGSKHGATGASEGTHHIRTNSVKKPTTFSKVTATKSFMNKVAPAAPTLAKIGEKPSQTAAPPAPANKPRLIAKTGASLANLQKSRLGTDGAGGPDASKVWNKNRPAPQAPPRQFTDEELKQQYGIHLATRLQTDGDGKEPKWADIDDDEDDWAPEAVVWMDGTKSTLAPDPAPPVKEQKPTKPQLPKPAEGVRPRLALKSERGGSEQQMKILKPGAGAAQAKPGTPGVPSPSPDKNGLSLKAKSPAPAPAKSPWAPIPKPESVAPINPPVQQSAMAPPPLPTQDARAYDNAQPVPAREIAADTFDRSWREGEGGTRELFNSSNGRYEPAPEGRRSSRPQSAFQKPALLQRGQAGASPAEPSAAFQSRTSSQVDGSWGRRRGSSVSQGSIPPPRRMSVNQRPELAGTPEGAVESISTKQGHGEHVRPSFSQQSAWDQQMPPQPEAVSEVPAPAVPTEDPVEVQKKLMAEKRELAIKRRKEEEEREEAAKQERLRAKLAALEGVGKSKKERDAEAAAAKTKDITTITEKSADAPATTDVKAQPQPVRPAEASAHAAPSLEAQTLPLASDMARKDASPDHSASSLPTKPQQSAERSVSDDQQQRQAPRQHLSPRANARAPFQQQHAPYQAPTSSYPSPGDRKQQPFGRSPNMSNDTFKPWASSQPNTNVWGTSGIGNGTFENSFGPMPLAAQSSLPPPPGMSSMGRPPTSTRISPQGGFSQESRSPSLQHQSVAEQQRGFSSPSLPVDSRDPFSQSTRLNGVSPAPGAGRPVHPPGPIGPPSRTQQPQSVARPDGISAWKAAANSLPTAYSAEAAAAEERRKREMHVPSKPSENRFKETFKQTLPDQGALGAPRRYGKTEYTIHDASGSRSVSSPTPPSTQTQPQAPVSASSPAPRNSWKAPHENHVRIPDGSQNPAHGGALPAQPPIGTPQARQPVRAYQVSTNFATAPLAPVIDSKDQSPPPPDADSHPVHEGDVRHPQVKLPKPAAKVRLPPTSPSGPPQPLAMGSSVLMPQRTKVNAYGPPGTRPITMDPNWQQRFNGLFNRVHIHTETPPSPPNSPPSDLSKPQRPALAVASSSRGQMDEHATFNATVALPQAKRAKSSEGFVIDNSKEVLTKPTIEQMFNEELSFGSRPAVRIPRNTNYDSKPAPAVRREYVNSKMTRPLEVETAREPWFYQHPQGYFVTIPFGRFHNKLFIKPGMENYVKPEKKEFKKFIKDRPELQDRTPSGRWAGKKAKEVSTPASSAPTGPAAELAKKEVAQKPIRQQVARQPSNAPVNDGPSEANKNFFSLLTDEADIRKPRRTNRGRGNRARGGRGHGDRENTAAAPALKSQG